MQHSHINVLKRNFKSCKPNEKWVTDVTEFSLFGEKLYLSPIMDLYNDEIVSYTLSDRPTFKLITDMIEYAFAEIPNNTNPILHSDQRLALSDEAVSKYAYGKGCHSKYVT